VDLTKIHFRATEEFRNQESGTRGRANKRIQHLVARLIEEAHLGDHSINLMLQFVDLWKRNDTRDINKTLLSRKGFKRKGSLTKDAMYV
jgi:replication initiation and membrane attachment protein DnaB